MKSPDHQAKRLVIISVIKEMQAELDTFFRAKKAKKVKLTSEDVLYLEVMLAQAIGAHPKPRSPVRGDPESMISEFAQRFLQEFFTLKTKPQVQLKESTFKMVKTMVDQTVSRALNQVKRELANSATDDESVVVYETDEENLITDTEVPTSVSRSCVSSSSASAVLASSSSSDSDVKQEESPEVSVFQTSKPRYIVRSRLIRSRRCKPSNGNDSSSSSCSSEDLWLSRGRVSPLGVSPQSPLNRGRLSIGSLCGSSSADDESTSNQVVTESRRLPIKKRRPSTEAVVPDLRSNNPSPNLP